jgi:uncharacterized protein
VIRTVALSQVADQPWRNGGGSTRELLAWPHADDWQLRISVARIDRDGPFSAYPGVQRWFAVLQGAGVVLHGPAGETRMTRAEPPLPFDGADAPGCTLIDGPTLDLNVMLRGAAGGLSVAQPGTPCPWPTRWRGLFSHSTAALVAGDRAFALAAGTLLWSDEASAAPWHVQAHGEPLRAWWIHFEPQTA